MTLPRQPLLAPKYDQPDWSCGQRSASSAARSLPGHRSPFEIGKAKPARPELRRRHGCPSEIEPAILFGRLGGPRRAGRIPERLAGRLAGRSPLRNKAPLRELGFFYGHAAGRRDGEIDPNRTFRAGLQVMHAVAVSPQRRRDAAVRDDGLRKDVPQDTEFERSHLRRLGGECIGELSHQLGNGGLDSCVAIAQAPTMQRGERLFGQFAQDSHETTPDDPAKDRIGERTGHWLAVLHTYRLRNRHRIVECVLPR